MQTLRHALKYIVVFLLVVALLTALLVLSACIPKSAIQENTLESAQFLCEGELFGTVVDGVEGSKIDRYADSILLGIAWQYDSTDPLQSVMLSSYYHTKYQNENENLLDAVTENLAPNQQYLRYWHGSNVLVRLLLLVCSIEQIYLLNGIAMALLTAWLLEVLCRRKYYIPACGIGLALVLTASWFVHLSLEYTWTYLLMLAGSIAAVKLACTGKWQHMGIFFLLSGMLTNYLDFLTTETLTLLVPLLLVLWIDLHVRRQTMRSVAANAGKAAWTWLLGYGGMWLTKWILASLVLGKNVLPYVTGHIQQRVGGEQSGFAAIVRNVRYLFPLEYGAVGMVVAIGLVLILIYVGYVYHKKQINKPWILLLFMIGTVPYIRYMVLSNHAYLHCFFTYRAQMATIVALVMIIGELIEWRWLTHGTARKAKR